MTLDEILSLARDVAPVDIHPQFANDPEVLLARAVISLLGASQPCGWPEPVVDRSLSPVCITWDALPRGEEILPDEARSIALMLLRAADEAEGRK